MQMTVGRRLAEAVGSWLHLEFCCYRAGLLSEGALKAAVGQMPSSFPTEIRGSRAYSDFPHEGLNPVRRPGRKKEVDFALVLAGAGIPKKNAEVLVEAKWANSSYCTPENIFSDFLRLAALKKVDPGAKCIFLLAGHTRAMERVTGGIPFISGTAPKTAVGFSGYERRVKLDPSNFKHRAAWGRTINDLLSDGLDIPSNFVARSCHAHPIQSTQGTVDFQAQCWEIIEVAQTSLRLCQWP